jgi:hydroxyacylglutathione hydrolase
MTEIRTLSFRFVNAYLIKTDAGFVLVDTGMRGNRARLERGLRAAGCRPGNLKLIVVTHGDADHAGSAAALRKIYGTKIAMHADEVPAVEQGNLFASRGAPQHLGRRLLKPLMSLFRLRKADRFTPDLVLKDGDRLDAYGVPARVLHVPGHSRGSIGILTDDGAFVSGDFLENRRHPSIATLVDDPEALKRSYERVKTFDVRTVYPGHGRPFRLEEIKTRPSA